MKYKLMVIDDTLISRKSCYEKVLSDYDVVFVESESQLESDKDIPFDGYIIDIFYEGGEWISKAADQIIKKYIENAPKSAPIFLISSLWGDTKVLDILKNVVDSHVKIVQFLSWSEFTAAADVGDQDPRREALVKKIDFELNRWHARSGFKPKPDDSINILILADTQFGDPKTDPKSFFSEHQIVAKLKYDARKIDLVAFAGDISYSGCPDEYNLAFDSINNDLLSPLWGSFVEEKKDRVLVTPGNHDVNLRFSACDLYTYNVRESKFIAVDSSSTSQHHSYSLEPFKRFAKKIAPNRMWDESSSLSWVDRRFRHCGFQVFNLNTVSKLDAKNPKRASFDEAALLKISRELISEDDKNYFNIVLSHHGISLTQSESLSVDNWDAIGKQFFLTHKINLWLFGHYHSFHVESRKFPGSNASVWCAQLPTPRIGGVERGCCVLELKRQDGNVVGAIIHYYAIREGGIEYIKAESVF